MFLVQCAAIFEGKLSFVFQTAFVPPWGSARFVDAMYFGLHEPPASPARSL